MFLQVAHKAGSMDVMASQATADVKLKSDTVNVDVNPGDLTFPVQGSTPKIAHIHQYIPPVLGKRSDPPDNSFGILRSSRLSRTLDNNHSID
jgi:hypothetical protein